MFSEMRRWILALLFLIAAGLRVTAAAAPSPEEDQALKAAAESFRLTYYERAEKDYAAFVQKFPASTRVPEAIFFQAEARLKQTNYAGTISLLMTNLPSAGAWTDKYLYCLAQAHLGLRDFDKASEAFGRLAKEFPAATNRLETSYQEALMRARLGAWTNVVHLLEDTNGVFRTLGTNIGNPLVFQGYLLLSEAQLALKNYAAAQGALDPFTNSLLAPVNAWQRQQLLCRIQVAASKLEEALVNADKLIVMASNTTELSFQAESFAVKGDILERLGRPDQAIAAYTNNLVEGVPMPRQREALFKTAGLSIAQNRIPEAAQILERFLNQYPKTASADLAWLSLGELRLRQFFESSNASKNPADPAGLTGDTNLLAKAKAALLTVTTNFSQSPVLGKSQMSLGWCYWFENNLVESEKQFFLALERLSRSPDRALTHFKLGDLQFKRGNGAGALTNYNAILEEGAADPVVETNLFELALYQTVRAALAVSSFGPATNALMKLLAWYPQSYRTDGAVLLTGQSISRENPVEAGHIYADFLKASPDATLRPELELAIARTHELQNAWTNAIAQYDNWLARFTNHPARPRAEFYRALALSHSGDPTNAFVGMTNLVARFPTNDLAPMAQWWMADFFFDRGAFALAESTYQKIEDTWPRSELAFQARLKAGHAAVGRQGWANAREYYFQPLATNPACPPYIQSQARFALGLAIMSQDSTNKADDYGFAINVFRRISETTNELAVLAWGQIASCYLQWAQSPAQLTNAVDYFQRIIVEPKADAAARSIAKVGLGVVITKQANEAAGEEQNNLRKVALDHYLDVFERKILRDGEQADPFWTKKAGMDAAQLASTLENWTLAARIYERLIELMPELQPYLRERLQKAQQAAIKMVKSSL